MCVRKNLNRQQSTCQCCYQFVSISQEMSGMTSAEATIEIAQSSFVTFSTSDLSLTAGGTSLPQQRTQPAVRYITRLWKRNLKDFFNRRDWTLFKWKTLGLKLDYKEFTHEEWTIMQNCDKTSKRIVRTCSQCKSYGRLIKKPEFRAWTITQLNEIVFMDLLRPVAWDGDD